MSPTPSQTRSTTTLSTALTICLAIVVYLSTLLPSSVFAAAPPEKVTLILKMAKGLTQAQAQAVVGGHGGSPKSSVPQLDLHIIEVPANAAEAIARAMKDDAQILRIESDNTRRLQGTPSDTQYSNQWALPKISWDQVYGTANPRFFTKVAILDTGVDGTHPDLNGVVVPGYSVFDGSNPLTDENGHGTWVAGIVAARTDNLQGIAGVGYDHVQVMPVKVLDPNGLGQDSDIIQGLLWATDNGASVILMAFSATGFSDALQDAIDYAWAHNVVVVAAVGNDSGNTATFPAGDRGVIGVSGTDLNDALAAGSNYGPAVFLAAPGIGIVGTYPNNSYVTWSGTSASAAIVAGTAALMRAVDPSLSNGVVVFRIASTADVAGTQEQSGNGRLNLARALSDTSTTAIQPAGTAPVGNGGPFVGPYVAAAINIGSFDSTCGTATTSFTAGTTACAKVTGLGGGSSVKTGTIEWWAPGAGSATRTTNFSTTSGNATDTFAPGVCGTWTLKAYVPAGTLEDTSTFNITNCNSAPSISRDSASVTVSEGQTAANTGSYSDANVGDTVTFSATVGTITKTGTNSGTWSWSFGTTDGPAQSQTVTITANDGHGGITTTNFSLTVNNVDPSGTMTNDGPKAEGTAVTITFAGTDASTVDAASLHYAFSCSNANLSSTTYAGAGTANTTTCTFNDEGSGSYTVSGIVIDKDGAKFATTTVVIVTNADPVVGTVNTSGITEGGTANISASFTDAGTLDTHTCTVNFGDGTPVTAGVVSESSGSGTCTAPSHVYADNNTGGNPYTVTITVADNDGGSGSNTGSQAVANANPAVGAVSTSPINEGAQATISANFTDAGTLDTHTCLVNFGDGTTGAGVVSETNGSGSCTATHTYTDNNVGEAAYTVTVTITDKDNGSNSNTGSQAVANLAPSGTMSNDGPKAEGTAVTITFAGTDASTVDAASLHYAFSCSNANLSSTTYAGAGAANTTTCTFNDEGSGSYTVSGIVIDKDGGKFATTTIVTVTNADPVVGVPSTSPINEGQSATVSANFTDAGTQDTHTCTVNFGDGTSVTGTVTETLGTGAGSCSASHTYLDNNGVNPAYTVTVTVTDNDGGSGANNGSQAVANVAPTAIFNSPAGSVNEGSTFSISLTSPVDVSADVPTLTYAFDCGTGFGLYSGDPTASCTAINDPGQTVKGRIKDKDGGISEYTSTVVVANVAPSNLVVALLSASISEDGVATLNGTFVDPGSQDVHSVSITWGDGVTTTATITPPGRSFSAMHKYLDDGPYPGNNTSSDIFSITVTVADNSSPAGMAAAGTQITVNNIAPAIGASPSITVPIVPMAAPASATITVNVPFSDVGSKDSHTCKVNFDDGSNASGTVNETIGSGVGTCTFSGSHNFMSAGVYTISVEIKDDDTGAVTYTAASLIVVYDPNGGFVTGGGWIASPPGAFVADPTLTGKAHFGFVSKYAKGANTPTGETEFQFQTAGLNFKSSSYQWLVVSGPLAQYKGSGTVNGVAGYDFLLTARDGNAPGGGGEDKFRIKITKNGFTFYDNVSTASDDINSADPQVLGGGSIVVHPK